MRRRPSIPKNCAGKWKPEAYEKYPGMRCEVCGLWRHASEEAYCHCDEAARGEPSLQEQIDAIDISIDSYIGGLQHGLGPNKGMIPEPDIAREIVALEATKKILKGLLQTAQ